MTFVSQDPVDAGQRVEVPLGIELPSERTHAQVGDPGSLSRCKDVEPLGLGSPVDTEAALGTDICRVSTCVPGVLVDSLAQIRVLLG